MYGSLLGALGLAAAASYAARAADIRSGEDLGERLRQGLAPLSATLRGWVLPVKERAEAWVGTPQAPAPAPSGAAAPHVPSEASGGDGGAPSRGAAAQFSRRLQEKLNTRRDGGAAAEA